MIGLSKSPCHAGGTVSGHLLWGSAAETPTRPVTVWLVWHVTILESGMIEGQSRVIEDYAVVAKQTFAPARSIAFDFAIPGDGPVSFAGQLFRLDWAIVVGTESNRGIDVEDQVTFTVGPRPADASRAVASEKALAQPA